MIKVLAVMVWVAAYCALSNSEYADQVAQDTCAYADAERVEQCKSIRGF